MFLHWTTKYLAASFIAGVALGVSTAFFGAWAAVRDRRIEQKISKMTS